MDNILQNLESLSRTELVWHRFGGATPCTATQKRFPPVPEVVPHGSVAMQGPNGVTSQQGAKVAPLPDRIDAFNSSLDPWERTGAAPQGWATHLRQAMVPIQGCIQLRPQTEGTLPAFGFDIQSPSGGKVVPDSGGQPHESCVNSSKNISTAKSCRNSFVIIVSKTLAKSRSKFVCHL